ncbi:hypothetical protein [Paenibacillus sp. MMO-177]|uniref:hypothetical protein n=1 Tax=Paenibacillus sp. MMO-177 TaxID=3081289 RepID=UPI003018FD65
MTRIFLTGIELLRERAKELRNNDYQNSKKTIRISLKTVDEVIKKIEELEQENKKLKYKDKLS